MNESDYFLIHTAIFENICWKVPSILTGFLLFVIGLARKIMTTQSEQFIYVERYRKGVLYTLLCAPVFKIKLRKILI